MHSQGDWIFLSPFGSNFGARPLATLKAHSVAYNVAAAHFTSSIPSEPKDQRKLLDKIIKRAADQGTALLLKYRDGNKKPLSDKDLKSSLEDLEELGALKE